MTTNSETSNTYQQIWGFQPIPAECLPSHDLNTAKAPPHRQSFHSLALGCDSTVCCDYMLCQLTLVIKLELVWITLCFICFICLEFFYTQNNHLKYC